MSVIITNSTSIIIDIVSNIIDIVSNIIDIVSIIMHQYHKPAQNNDLETSILEGTLSGETVEQSTETLSSHLLIIT